MARRHRLGWRLIWHHAWLAAACLVLVVLVRALFAGGLDDEVHQLSLATAYVGLLLVVATLAIGPINLMRARPSPLSDDLRRDVGIWSVLLMVIHTLLGVQIHMGSPWWYFFFAPGTFDPDRLPAIIRRIWTVVPIRTDVFGVANYTGLLATLIGLGLLVLSNDLSMRKLGNRRWKRLQQLNYVLLALTVAHGVLYQGFIETGRPRVWLAVFWLMWGLALVLQLAGMWWRVFRTAPPDRATTRSAGTT